MFRGIYSTNNMNNSQRISDIGANKVLNMGGSINSYIRTGNPYSTAYYANKQKESFDEFVKQEKKTKKDGIIEKAIGAIVCAGALFAVFKGRKHAGNSPSRIKGIMTSITKPFRSVGGWFSGIVKKITKKP